MVKLGDDERNRQISESLSDWLEDAVIGMESALRSRTDYVSGIVLALGFDPRPIKTAVQKYDRKTGTVSPEMQEAGDLIEAVLTQVIGAPWHAAGTAPPPDWHGPVTGSREALSKAIRWSDAKNGAFRLFESGLRRNLDSIWCRQTSPRRFDVWFKNRTKYEETRNRLGTDSD